jgi:hypothetical protein
MSEIFDRYLGQNVLVLSGAGASGFNVEGSLRETEGQWFVVDTEESGRTFVRRDLTFWIVADPPADARTTLPRPARGNE